MKKYFGTDGIRGVANRFLTPELAFKVGRVLGAKVKRDSKLERPYVYIGKDSRINSPMLEYSTISGLLSSGVDVKRLHLTPTPAVAYLTKSTEASLGIMISASHNPFYDNGIKIFGPNGLKLRDEEELLLEEAIDNLDVERAINENVGVVLNRHESIYQYIESLFFSVKKRFDGLKIGLDCANGSTSIIAKRLFVRLGAEVLVINDQPNGTNINENCGATSVESLQKLVLDNKLDFGFAFDGDGDRVMSVDNEGNVIDGDHMILLFAKYYKSLGKLKNNTVATTLMSNMGLFVALEEYDIKVNVTDVGDRYVLANMIDNELIIGGEQSGHIILLENNTCGDGMLTALQFASLVVNSGKTLGELGKELVKYPQLLGKVRVENKQEIMMNPVLLSEVDKANAELGSDGRVVIRPSGTEPVVRVMVEASNEQICEQYYNHFFDLVVSLT